MTGENGTRASEDYGFEPRWTVVEGGRMHYVDEGSGPPLVLVHGTPTWSYLWRHLVRGLSREHRVVAPDNLGFGRSEKPPEADYRPEVQARRLASLIDGLRLERPVLAVHDFGGPIGLSYAIERPESVRGLVLFNTWMWSLAGTPAERMGRAFGGRIGRALYTRLNFSPRVLLPAAYADRSRLSREVHRRYLEPFPTRESRTAPWVYARELARSGAWYEALWERRQRIREIPTLIVWGAKDPAFGPPALARWREALPAARVVEIADAGHFPQEEAPERVEREMRSFLEGLES